MTVMSLLSSVPDFDGKICHIVEAGNGTLIFVRPLTWSQKYDEISSKIQELTSTLKKVDYLSGVNLGEVYLVKLNSSIERSYFIRRPKPNTYSELKSDNHSIEEKLQIYLIDKGMQCDIHCGEIYECPSQIMKFELFSCVCPVLVPSIQPMDIYNSLVEHNCKCIVETVSKSAVVVGFVRGQLQVEVNERYENLSDIVARMTNDCSENSGNIAGIKVDISSSSSDTTTYTSVKLSEPCTDPAAVDVGRRHEMPKIRNLFIQTAFKHYEPEMLPITVNVRFDKKDRFWDTFWVVNTKIFSVVQTLLKESENKISYFPILSHQSSNIWMRQTPCLVRIKGDYTLRGLHRAVPAKYDTYTKKFSIFLVDYGWFRWVSESDIIDISTLDKASILFSGAFIFSY
ncbi:unnamed protein product [Thelazia callipaeda]|uniref:Tudor domain-containing protein n=1 Tax=Thelazia callipaeda TaxID=103827 RepID=A0A0N5CRH8_THECL|nr:unnamed protein product [Thelazia callipaeda]